MEAFVFVDRRLQAAYVNSTEERFFSAVQAVPLLLEFMVGGFWGLLLYYILETLVKAASSSSFECQQDRLIPELDLLRISKATHPNLFVTKDLIIFEVTQET